jgi:hypothetical protein
MRLQSPKRADCTYSLSQMNTMYVQCVQLDITHHQYNKNNVVRFSFNLLRIKGLYMFRALLAHPQEALQNLIWILRACNISCAAVARLQTVAFCNRATAVQLTYARNI